MRKKLVDITAFQSVKSYIQSQNLPDEEKKKKMSLFNEFTSVIYSYDSEEILRQCQGALESIFYHKKLKCSEIEEFATLFTTELALTQYDAEVDTLVALFTQNFAIKDIKKRLNLLKYGKEEAQKYYMNDDILEEIIVQKNHFSSIQKQFQFVLESAKSEYNNKINCALGEARQEAKNKNIGPWAFDALINYAKDQINSGKEKLEFGETVDMKTIGIVMQVLNNVHVKQTGPLECNRWKISYTNSDNIKPEFFRFFKNAFLKEKQEQANLKRKRKKERLAEPEEKILNVNLLIESRCHSVSSPPANSPLENELIPSANRNFELALKQLQSLDNCHDERKFNVTEIPAPTPLHSPKKATPVNLTHDNFKLALNKLYFTATK